MRQSFRRQMSRIVKIIASFVVIVAALCLFPTARRASICDFAAYWTGSRLIMSRHNPYDWDAVINLERPFGVNELNPLIIRNPPWALIPILPFGLLSYGTGRMVWLLIQIALTIWSVQMLCRMYGNDLRFRHRAWGAVAIFTPLYVALAIGQITPVVLAGITGFLYAQQKQQDAIAGAYLFLAALKPHLLFLVWPILLAWVIATKRYKILVTLGILLLSASAIPLLFDPTVFKHYFDLWAISPIVWSKTSNLSGTVCRIFGSNKLVAFSLSFFSLIWAGYYWRIRRRDWNWLEQIPLLLLISVVVSPYDWLFDQTILIPALISSLALRFPTERHSIFVCVLYVCVNLSVVGLVIADKDSLWSSWTGPVWLLLYLASLHTKQMRTRFPQQASVTS